MSCFRVLFWNINKNDTEELRLVLKKAVVEYELDLLVLAENKNIRGDKVEQLTNLKLIEQEGSDDAKQWLQLYGCHKLVDNELITTSIPFADKPFYSEGKMEFAQYLTGWPRIVPFTLEMREDLKVYFCAVHAPSAIWRPDENELNLFAKQAKIHMVNTFSIENEWADVKAVAFGGLQSKPLGCCTIWDWPMVCIFICITG